MAQSPNAGPSAAAGAKKLMLMLSGGAGLVLLGGGGLLVGLNSELTGRQTLAGQKEAEVGSNEQIAKRYQTTLDNYTDTQGRIKFLESSVTPKSYVPTLLGQLQSLAASTHLLVTSVRPAAPPPPAPPPAPKPASADGSAPLDAKKAAPPPYDTLGVDVDVTGTYADTATFLYDLTRFPKIISVVGAQMHPNAAAPGAGSPTVSTSLKLVAFMFHGDDSAPADPAGTSPAGTSPAGAVAAAPDLMGHADVTPISAAAGRAERGAVGAVRASNDRVSAASSVGNTTL